MTITNDQLHNWFTHHPPRTGDTVEKYRRLRDSGFDFALRIVNETPPGPEQDAAVMLVRQAVMMANAAIACAPPTEAGTEEGRTWIDVNGEAVSVPAGKKLTYKQICELTDLDPQRNPSVYYNYSDDVGGMLDPHVDYTLQPRVGLRITVKDTGGA